MALEVNGEIISNAAIREQIAFLRALLEGEGGELSLEDRLDLRTRAIDNLIERTVMMQEARRLGLSPSPEEIEETAADLSPRGEGISGCRAGADATKLRADAERGLLLNRLLDYHWDRTPAPSASEVRKYYRANRETIHTPEMVRASHLVKHFDGQDRGVQRERVQALRDRLVAGEDLAALARTESDCPENDGNLGWFPRGTMVEEFDDVVFGASAGTLTEVFETRFGAHVAMVHARREAGIPSLEEMADSIELRLRREKLDLEIGWLLQTLISRAVVREIP